MRPLEYNGVAMCAECEKAQHLGLVTYYRFQNANIAIAGCKPHVRQMLAIMNCTVDYLRKLQKEMADVGRTVVLP